MEDNCHWCGVVRGYVSNDIRDEMSSSHTNADQKNSQYSSSSFVNSSYRWMCIVHSRQIISKYALISIQPNAWVTVEPRKRKLKLKEFRTIYRWISAVVGERSLLACLFWIRYYFHSMSADIKQFSQCVHQWTNIEDASEQSGPRAAI